MKDIWILEFVTNGGLVQAKRNDVCNTLRSR